MYRVAFNVLPMSCRKCLHLVSDHGSGLYSLSRMAVSSLFYPSTAAAEAAEAEHNKNKDVMKKLGLIGSITAPLPKPTVHYEAFRPTVPSSSSSSSEDPRSSSSIELFALLGKNNILCSDKGGHTGIYDTQMHAFVPMPKMISPKGPRSIAAYITRTPDHARHDFDVGPEEDYNVFAFKPMDEHNDSLYVIDMDRDNPCSFELLACYPVGRWCWAWMDPPPFFDDPGYMAPNNVAFTVVDGTGICVSTTTASYLFNTVNGEWRKIGDWVLPFHDRAEFIPELRLWLGVSSASGGDLAPYDLCAVDLSPAVAAGSGDAPPPVVQHIGIDVGLPEEWSLRHRTLVNLQGSGMLCVASFFHDADSKQQVLVLTGVHVVPCRHDQEGRQGFQMIKHKSKCFVTDNIKYVL